MEADRPRRLLTINPFGAYLVYHITLTITITIAPKHIV